MQIIGHRGAAGLAPENTIAAIKAGLAAGVDAIEFDIRATADGHLVLSHDASLERTHGVDRKVHHLPVDEVKLVRSDSGHAVPTLKEAVKACGTVPAYIEGKSGNWAKPLARFLKKHGNTSQFTVMSFSHEELSVFRKLCPEIPTLVLEHQNPFDAINAARIYGFDGIDINHWTLNPLTYWLARRHRLAIVVFTVNRPWVASFIRAFYPGVALTTDVPNKMQFLRPKPVRARKKRP